MPYGALDGLWPMLSLSLSLALHKYIQYAVCDHFPIDTHHNAATFNATLFAFNFHKKKIQQQQQLYTMRIH